MFDTVVKVENLGKKYLLGHQQQGRSPYVALRDVLTSKAKSVGRSLLQHRSKSNPAIEEFWALQNVSFEIKRGDRLGIIGRNGAGKSTLLKLLSRITDPTTGRICIKGRVASLLEVGTGFHPELTGRENIYLNGAILGMSKLEIKRKFDEIVFFAEVEKFLDTPVKRYSSGMYVRLAFAVAAHLEPEILIVDEVLAVGDAAFQKKCLGKMEEVGKEGRTVLFVSHNMGTIKTLCNSAMLLEQGKVVAQGTTAQVVDSYLNSATIRDFHHGEVYWQEQEAPGGEELRLASLRLLNSENRVQSHFDAEEPIQVEIVYRLFTQMRGMRIILQILTSEGIIAFSSTDHALRTEEEAPGLYKTNCTIPAFLLNFGRYSLKLHIGCPGVKVLLQGQEFLGFYVENANQHGSIFPEKWPGVVAPKLSWKTSVKI
ncbi:MAG: ABC transporter ATP-binding protein [Cyanophyceae cyanobacterium]